MPLTFYDIGGNPIIYTQDDQHLYDFEGSPVAYFYGNSVYSFSGRHLGWFEKGWIKDANGNYFLFSETATGGPLKPLKKLKPLKGLKQLKPLKGLRELKPLKPLSSLSWSRHSPESFFK